MDEWMAKDRIFEEHHYTTAAKTLIINSANSKHALEKRISERQNKKDPK